MTAVFPQSAIDFLADLEANNTKEWFQANKKRYEKELKAPARALVTAVNDALGAISPSHTTDTPHKTLSRINRDIRFSKDKTPYNAHVWAGFSLSGAPKGCSASYFVGVSPTGWGVGAGVWKPEKEHLESLRRHFSLHHEELHAMTSDPEWRAIFGELGGEAYKRVPKPYDPDHPAGDLLKLKNAYVRSEGDIALVPTDDFLPEIERRLRMMKPLVDFLNKGLGVA